MGDRTVSALGMAPTHLRVLPEHPRAYSGGPPSSRMQTCSAIRRRGWARPQSTGCVWGKDGGGEGGLRSPEGSGSPLAQTAFCWAGGKWLGRLLVPLLGKPGLPFRTESGHGAGDVPRAENHPALAECWAWGLGLGCQGQ